MKSLLETRLYSVDRMLKPGEEEGEIPPHSQIYRNFFKVGWPSALEAVLVSLVGMVDTVMVSGLGEEAIDAVGITNQPKFILLAAIMSLNVGVTAVVARRKGQEKQKSANRCLMQCMLVSGAIAILMSVLGFIFAPQIISVMGANEDYFNDAVLYFRILMCSIPFTGLNLTINAAQRGVGKTKISMVTNLIANLVNLVFNYLLINGIGIFPKLGVAGAAIATGLGALTACIIAFFTLLRPGGYLTILHTKLKDWKFDSATMRTVANISSSALVEQAFMRIGFLVYNMMVARLGTLDYATHLICMNILNLSFSFGDGFGVAASSLVGQSLGAKRPDLAKIYGKTGQRIACSISFLLCVIFLVFRYQFMGWFTNDPGVISLGGIIMCLVSGITFAQTSQVVISGCLRGAGDTRFVALVSMISITFVRPFLTWLLCFPMGYGLIGAWVGVAIDQVIRLVMNYWRFNQGKWKYIQI